RRPRLEHEGVAFFARHRHEATERDRRSHETRRHWNASALVLDRPRFWVETRHNAVVGEEIEVVAVQDVREHVARAFGILPGHTLSIRHGTGAYRNDLLHRIAGRDDHETMTYERRVDGIALDPGRPPQFFSGRGIVGDDELAAVRHELGASRGLHEYR